MTALETYQAAQAALSSATDATRDQAQLAVDAAARNLRREEILAMPEGEERAALLAPLGANPEPVNLPPSPSQAELDEARFRRRSAAHEVLSTEFGAWNLGRIRSGEFTGQEIDDWLELPAIQRVLGQLRRYSFEMAIAGIQALPIEGPTTQSFKDTWIPKIQAAL